jgi:hypothetical protein
MFVEPSLALQLQIEALAHGLPCRFEFNGAARLIIFDVIENGTRKRVRAFSPKRRSIASERLAGRAIVACGMNDTIDSQAGEIGVNVHGGHSP